MRFDMASFLHSTFTEKRPGWSVNGLPPVDLRGWEICVRLGTHSKYTRTELSNIQMDLKDAFFTQYGFN